MRIKIQYGLFMIGDDAASRMRDTWEDAAQDAVNLEIGRWTSKHEFVIDPSWQIRAVRVPK